MFGRTMNASQPKFLTLLKILFFLLLLLPLLFSFFLFFPFNSISRLSGMNFMDDPTLQYQRLGTLAKQKVSGLRCVWLFRRRKERWGLQRPVMEV